MSLKYPRKRELPQLVLDQETVLAKTLGSGLQVSTGSVTRQCHGTVASLPWQTGWMQKSQYLLEM